MNNQEPQIYQQLRQITEDATHFKEALRLIAAAHKLFVVEITDGWYVQSADGIIEEKFATFSQAFEFVMGLLE